MHGRAMIIEVMGPKRKPNAIAGAMKQTIDIKTVTVIRIGSV